MLVSINIACPAFNKFITDIRVEGQFLHSSPALASCDHFYGSSEGQGCEGGSLMRALTVFSFICSIREALAVRLSSDKRDGREAAT